MKNLSKITALLLVGLTSQTELAAGQYAPGPRNFVTTCQVIRPNQQARVSGAARARFQEAYGGLLPDQVCTQKNYDAVSDILLFINGNSLTTPAIPRHFNGVSFVDDAGDVDSDFAGQFAQNFADYSFLFGNNIFSTNYLGIATKQMETAINVQTGRGDTHATALRTIGETLQQQEPTRAAAFNYMTEPEADVLARIGTLATTMSDDEKSAKELLNTLGLQYDATVVPPAFAPNALPLTVGAGDPNPAVYQPGPLSGVIQATFARRMLALLPNATLFPLIQDPAVAARDQFATKITGMLKGGKFSNAYARVEKQVQGIVTAMAQQITDTDAVVSPAIATATTTGMAAPADGRLATKTGALITYLQGHAATGGGLKTAVEGAFDSLAVRLGLAAPVAPAHVVAATAITNAGTQIDQSAAALMAVDTLMRSAADITANHADKLTLTQLAQAAATAIRDADGAVNTAASAATGAPHAFVETTLVGRINALVPLLKGSGSTGIQTYIANLVAQTKAGLATATAVPSEFAAFVPVVGQVRADLGYGAAGIKDEYEVFADQCAGMKPNVDHVSTTDAKVKAAVNYLMDQLYTSYMWLTSDKDTAGAKIAAVPAFAGSATNIGKATEARIRQLNSEIGTLSTENAAFRAAGGGAGAESNPDVISIVAQINSLDGILDQCGAVHGSAAGSPAQLALVPAAVTQMTQTLSRLGALVHTGLPATNGNELFDKVRTAIIQNDGEITGAATSISNLKTLLTSCDGLFTGRALTNTVQFERGAQDVATALDTLATDAGLAAIHPAVIPAANGADLAAAIKKALEDNAKAAATGAATTAATGPLITALTNLNNDVLGGFINVPTIAAGADLTATQAAVLANATTIVQIIQKLAHDAGIKTGAAGAAVVIPDIVAGTPLTQPDKLAPARLATLLRLGTFSSYLTQLLTPASTSTTVITAMPAGSLDYDKFHVQGMTDAELTALPNSLDRLKGKTTILRGSLALSIALYDKLGIVAPGRGFADFAALQTEMLSAIDQIAHDAKQDLLQELLDKPKQAGYDGLNITGLSFATGGDIGTYFQPVGLKYDQAKVLEFYNQCVLAVAKLRELGDVKTPFNNVTELMNQSAAAITAKMTAAGGAAGAVPGAKYTDADLEAAIKAERTEVAGQLMDAASGTLGFTAFPATFTLASLNLGAALPDGTNLVVTADFYRQCALAADLLKVEGGVAGPFTDMQDLMTKSVAGIRQKITAADAAGFARGQAAAPAAAAAPANYPVAIAIHNATAAVIKDALNAGATQAWFDAAVAFNTEAQTLFNNQPLPKTDVRKFVLNAGTVAGAKAKAFSATLGDLQTAMTTEGRQVALSNAK